MLKYISQNDQCYINIPGNSIMLKQGLSIAVFSASRQKVGKFCSVVNNTVDLKAVLLSHCNSGALHLFDTGNTYSLGYDWVPRAICKAHNNKQYWDERMESASLVLLSNKTEDILNIIHILKVANYIKKRGGQNKETRPGRPNPRVPTFEVIVCANGFYLQTNQVVWKRDPKHYMAARSGSNIVLSFLILGAWRIWFLLQCFQRVFYLPSFTGNYCIQKLLHKWMLDDYAPDAY